MNRREFIAVGAASSALNVGMSTAADAASRRQANGVKVGEVTDTSAILWTRLTTNAARNGNGMKIVGRPKKDKAANEGVDPATFVGACPGAPGRIRVRYGKSPELTDAKLLDWVEVSAMTDFTHSFALTELPADTPIYYSVETAEPGKMGNPHGSMSGTFRTAPKPDQQADLAFAVVTCQMFNDLDHGDGFKIYPAIAQLAPRFVAFTGDNVYYDGELPIADSIPLARYHWERMYSLPRHVELLRQVASYWEKDDHDTVKNDCWPGQRLGELTYPAGQKIFREQVPIGDSIYRTFRWGKSVQVWLTDGRDFRSPNNMKDGPAKTIWGKEQKDWLFRTVKASDATWKVLISPTPLVGPDRGGKGDNHANAAFKTEGDEIRAWFKENVPSNFFVVCGDRHWQYHSVHPNTGLNEFSVGPASDVHAGGTPGEDKTYHRFHRVKGGFLSVAVAGKSITFNHHDVDGKIVYRHEVKA